MVASGRRPEAPIFAIRAGAAGEYRVGHGRHQHDHYQGDERQQASVEQICLHGAQELGHGFTLTIAGAVGELDAPVVEAALGVPPAPAAGVTPSSDALGAGAV